MCVHKYKKAVFVVASLGFLLLFLFMSSFMGVRCDIPEANAISDTRCGHPLTNWLYDFQSLFAGILASLAAAVTVYEMRKNTRTMYEIANRDYDRAIYRAHELFFENCLEVQDFILRFNNSVSPLGVLINIRKLSKSIADLIRTIERIEDKNWDIEFSFPFRVLIRDLKDHFSWLDRVYLENKEAMKVRELTMGDFPVLVEKLQSMKERNDVLIVKVKESRLEFFHRRPQTP